jgi:hypothetical protein
VGGLDGYIMEFTVILVCHMRAKIRFVTSEQLLPEPPSPDKPSDRRRLESALRTLASSPRLVAASEAATPRLRLPLLPVDNIVLCDYPGLDPAGRWCECAEPLCPHAAYLTTLYPSLAEARRQARARAELYARLNLPGHLRLVLSNHRLVARRLRSRKLRGRDYRDGSCRIPNAVAQLRDGHGREPAWLEIKRQRVVEGADAALLPSDQSPCGELFLYASALEMVELGEVEEEFEFPFRW